MLDVGTDRQSLLEDPLYLGYRHRRVRGEEYHAFIDKYISTALRLYPKALLHWEDFGAVNARWILETYRSRICTFNDDVQGTGGIVLAAVIAALKVTAGRMRIKRSSFSAQERRVAALPISSATVMISDGLTAEAAARRFLVRRPARPPD